MRMKRFIATASTAVALTSTMIAPAHAEDTIVGHDRPATDQQPVYAENTETPTAQTPSDFEQAQFDLRKQELSTEQAKLSIDSIKTILKAVLFFTGVGIPLALTL